MIEVRKSEDRGHANHGWLDSYHTFSFADYYDSTQIGFGPLRVINEDWIAPGTGFGTHAHRDMEIITYVLEGELGHKDSMGNGSVIRPGNVQRMSAGTGVRHSEFNHSAQQKTHLLQIWIEPNVLGVEPGYEERNFDATQKRGQLRLVASPDGRDGSVTIHQDAKLYVGLFDDNEHARIAIPAGRRAYLHVARGDISANGVALKAGDALKFLEETEIELNRGRQAELLLFDLP
ncbi:MAG: quercetin 2,3-dioxygenase [Burkholderiales bacterium RIFCSPLOWO2_02_FULL_57_36]|nr:MAG: quercetin 2,3-dioxygenase [Burkholderiales bacterium RIFCSPLOWO2_02_FULL_57_36]